MKFPFVGPTYQSWSLRADAQRAINLYPEVIESGSGKSEAALYGTPGLHTWATLPASPVRGLWAGEGRLFAAAGTGLYEVFSGGSYTVLGTIADDADHSPVQMFPNGNQLFVVSANKGYLADGVTVTEVVPAVTGAFLDGYFIAQQVDSKQFRISSLLDGTTWDPLDYATKEGYPDNIQALLADHEELWLFGTTKSTEVWRNTGNPDFPFQPEPGSFIPIGLRARWSAVSLAGQVYWIGCDEAGHSVAYRAQGYQPARVSNHAIEAVWQSYSTVADAIAYPYIDAGHAFWVINFPSADATWVYDAKTGMWHERAWWNGSVFSRHRARCHAFAFGKHLVGDYQNGKIYEMSTSFYDDDGADIRRVRTAPHLADEDERFFFHRFQLDMEAGMGLQGQPEPAVLLDWSDDGGKTFNTPKSAGSGTYQQYTKRVIWRRLGAGRDRVFRVTMTGKTKVALVNAYLDLTKGTS